MGAQHAGHRYRYLDCMFIWSHGNLKCSTSDLSDLLKTNEAHLEFVLWLLLFELFDNKNITDRKHTALIIGTYNQKEQNIHLGGRTACPKKEKTRTTTIS